MKFFFRLSFLFVLLAISLSIQAQSINLDDTTEVKVEADRLEYDADRKLLIGTGNVLVSQGNASLKADFVTVHTVSEEVYAAGNVSFNDIGKTWQGDELTYNFQTEQGDFGEFEAFLDPLYIRAISADRTRPGYFVVKEPTMSTCEGEEPEFYITAEEASLEDDRYVRAKHAVFHLGGLPVFYVPYYKFDLDRQSHWDFLPGYRSTWGAFLLSTYSMRINEIAHSRTHFDVRTKRGLALGQDFLWENENMRGKVKGYYAHDNDPHYDEDLTADEKKLIDSDRYRLLLEHSQAFTDKDYFIANLDYVSDPEMMNDFFTSEYEDNVQPENYLSFTHLEDRYVASILVNRRLNDFYENVNRLPEATLDFRRTEIADSDFYYAGNNSATYLEKVYPNQKTNKTDYSTFRFDTRHDIYYPQRVFGFLNVIPRMGYEGTYYDKTKITDTSQQIITTTTTNSAHEVTTTTKTQTVYSVRDGSSKWRNLPELGIDLSYQAFKILSPAREKEGGIRHVAEPYTKYTFVPEPSVTSDDLYQFDDIDELGKQNFVRLGMRNKIQTKRKGSVANLINLDIYMDYRFDPNTDDDEYAEGPIVFDAESYLTTDLTVKFDGSMSTHGDSFTNFNSRIKYTNLELGEYGAEYRYLVGKNDQVQAYFDLFPNNTWSFGLSWRYEFNGAVMEEQSYYIGHKSECLGTKFGYTGHGDDWDIWFQIWLMAFPDSRIESAVSY